VTELDAALADLDARQPETMPGPSLARIGRLAALLDDPQRTYPTIHVTGTNGKTTAARAAAAVACAVGIRTGLFTSPHLRSVRERLSVCGEDISEAAFAEEYAHLRPFLEHVDGGQDGPVTYFEALTALAFLWFADRPVDLGVFEVGMGGGWDATNLVAGEVAVITPIDLDHVAILGPTIEDIAGEKAGILKPVTTAVVREQDHAEAAAVLDRQAREVGARLLHEGEAWEVEEELGAVGGQRFALRGLHGRYEDLYLPLFGTHAVHNAAAGLVAVEALTGQALDEDAARDGIASARVPGRLEVVGTEPLIVLDGAHNPAGARALAEALPRSFTWLRLHLVVAVSSDKDLAGVVGPIAALADVVYATRFSGSRSAAPDAVADAARAAGAADVEVSTSLADAIASARTAATTGDAIVVTGSLLTVGEALAIARG
jgi:dihydrofolate synthase / folylpolyglutamate synthase